MDVWTEITGHRLAEDRQTAFKARPEVRALGRFPADVLYGTGWATLRANRDGHLLLGEWLATIDGSTPDEIRQMVIAGQRERHVEQEAARAHRRREETRKDAAAARRTDDTAERKRILEEIAARNREWNTTLSEAPCEACGRLPEPFSGKCGCS